MQDLLIQAEKIIRLYAKPEDAQKYNEQKKAIFLVPFSDVVTTYQRENKELSKKIIEMRSKLHTNLREYTQEFLAQQLKVFNIEHNGEHTIECLLKSLHFAVKRFEDIQHEKIERYNTNSRVYRRKLGFMGNYRIKTEQEFEDKREILQEERNDIHRKIENVQKELIRVHKQNQNFVKALNALNVKIASYTTSSNSKQKSLEEAKINQENILNQKQAIEKQLQSLNDKVNSIKIIQRYGRTAQTPEKKKKIEQIIELKKKVKTLENESSRLKEQMKQVMLESMLPSNSLRISFERVCQCVA